MFSCLLHGEVAICSLGGGPGSDAVAVQRLLRKMRRSNHVANILICNNTLNWEHAASAPGFSFLEYTFNRDFVHQTEVLEEIQTAKVVTVTCCLDYVSQPVQYMEELLALMPPGSLLIVAEPLRIPVQVKLALDEAVGHDQHVVYNSRSDPDPRFSGKYFEWEHGTSRHKPQALEAMMTMN
ncbi:hypothetical protein DUNSADRAFT_3686 [Dunaliella salina]|nr:hypothetical protein DUNSADRAFT_3686 [Dunaliella salina]|eukprot:KAF5837910.1 hypothetical protein DUNSADRAFT_3686 [Dunaliella salina]